MTNKLQPTESSFRILVTSVFGNNVKINSGKCEIMDKRKQSAWGGLIKRSVDTVAATITADGAGQNIYGKEWADIGIRVKHPFKDDYMEKAEDFARKYSDETGKEAKVYQQ